MKEHVLLISLLLIGLFKCIIIDAGRDKIATTKNRRVKENECKNKNINEMNAVKSHWVIAITQLSMCTSIDTANVLTFENMCITAMLYITKCEPSNVCPLNEQYKNEK